MNQSIAPQHPAVVLRSHYTQLRTLLVIAMIAVVGLTGAVVILATNNDGTPASSAAPVSAAVPATPGQRYDGGPDEGTRGQVQRHSAPSPGIRYDGGPEEGTRGFVQRSSAPSPGIRYDGGPEEGTSSLSR